MYISLKSIDGTLREADAAMRVAAYDSAAKLLADVQQRQPRNRDIALRLATARRATGDVAGALDALGPCLADQSTDFLVQLMGGSLLATLGRQEESVRHYRRALGAMPDISMLPDAVRREVSSARNAVTRDDAWRDAVGAIVFTDVDGDERDQLENLRRNILAGPRPDGAPGQFMIDSLPRIGFFDTSALDGVADLESQFETILSEFHAVLTAHAPELVSVVGHCGASHGSAPLRGSGKWSSIRLIAEGATVDANVRLAPVTLARYLSLGAPQVGGRSPNLMFSLLDAQTRIPTHTGVTNTRLVMHFPLIIPPDCGIRVGRETRDWTPGRVMIFDDTFDHEAWNDSDQLRVILLGDIWNPVLSRAERRGVAQLMNVAEV